MASWQQTQIGQFLFEREGKYKPDDETIAGLKRIEKIDFSGKFHIVQKPSATNMILICPGDLVISGINVSKGALGIYKGKEEVTATIHYSSYTFDIGRIDVEYFKRFLKSPEFIKLLKEQVKGGIKTEIKPKHILPIRVSLPDIVEQGKIVSHFKSIETENEELKSELANQKRLLKKLRQQILQEAIKGKLTAEWRQQTKTPPLPRGGAPKGRRSASSTNQLLSRQDIEDKRVQNQNQSITSRHTASKKKRTVNNLPRLKTFRKKLRKNLTPAEATLWSLLKGKQLDGRKFRRQHSVANYILDFYCPAEKLAIELDGSAHDHEELVERDRERDLFLLHTGIRVVRFENEVVFGDPEGLLAEVRGWFGCSGDGGLGENPSAPLGHLPLTGEEFLESSGAGGLGENPSALSGHLPLAGEEFLGSASELLERIREEKEQLIKDGEIRRQKPLPPITEDEKPFELPEGWVWCRLGDISINSLGKMLDQHKNKGVPKPYLRNLNVQWYKVNIDDLKEMRFEDHETEKYNVRNGDIVICEGGYPGQAAIWRNNHPVMFQKALHRVRFISACFNAELFVHLLWLWDSNGRINKYFTGTGIKHLTGKALNKMLLPLPPLPEQKAIVAKTETLLTLCDQLQTHITTSQAHAEQLMQSVLQEAFSQPGERVKQKTDDRQ